MNQALREVKPEQDMILIEHLPFQTDSGIASRARIGLIVLATDFTIEHEWRKIITPLAGVALYQSRILNDAQITPETLRAMEPRIASATDVILPGGELDVVAYGCTSASMAIGEEKVFQRIREVRPGAKGTTPITAAFAAFRAFGAKRIGVLTPHRRQLHPGARLRSSGLRLLQRAGRQHRGAHHAGVDPQRRAPPAGYGKGRLRLRLMHLGQAGGSGARHRGRNRRSHHLVQPCHGLARAAAGRRRRCLAAVGPPLH
jgi:hypothetical protein